MHPDDSCWLKIPFNFNISDLNWWDRLYKFLLNLVLRPDIVGLHDIIILPEISYFQNADIFEINFEKTDVKDCLKNIVSKVNISDSTYTKLLQFNWHKIILHIFVKKHHFVRDIWSNLLCLFWYWPSRSLCHHLHSSWWACGLSL